MNRFPYRTTAFAAMLALSAPAAQAGLHLNGPALDGRQVVLPDGAQTVGRPTAEEMNALSINGPALDGREVALPDGSQTVGRPAAEEMDGLQLNGPALDGRRVATPDLARRAVGHQRLPGDTGGILPIDQRWPGSAQNRQVQQ